MPIWNPQDEYEDREEEYEDEDYEDDWTGGWDYEYWDRYDIRRKEREEW